MFGSVKFVVESEVELKRILLWLARFGLVEQLISSEVVCGLDGSPTYIKYEVRVPKRCLEFSEAKDILEEIAAGSHEAPDRETSSTELLIHAKLAVDDAKRYVRDAERKMGKQVTT